MLKAIFQLVRPINLLVIVLTQYLVRHCVILPLYQPRVNDSTFLELGTSSLNEVQFFLLVLSTVLVAAAGYIINDYFDVEVDLVNKPEKVVVGKLLSSQQALLLYSWLNITGILLGFYVATTIGNYKLVFIHIFTAALLWFYSSTLKKKLLLGNLAIAFLSALVVIMVPFYESRLAQTIIARINLSISNLFERITGNEVTIGDAAALQDDIANLILVYIAAYSLFAFLLTLIREIIKDAQDYDGDALAGYQTLPIKIGIPGSNLFAVFFAVVTCYLVLNFQISQLGHGEYLVVAFTLLMIQFPLFFAIFRLRKDREKKAMGKLSHLMKFIMLMGLLYLPYFKTTIGVTPDSFQISDVQVESISSEPTIEDSATNKQKNALEDSLSVFDTLPSLPIDPDSAR